MNPYSMSDELPELHAVINDDDKTNYAKFWDFAVSESQVAL